MADRTARPTAGNGPAGGDRVPGIDLDPELVAAREQIRATLARICQNLIRPLPLSDGVGVGQLSTFITARQRELAAAPYAHLVVADLHDMRYDSQAARLAFPARRHHIFIGTCPLTVPAAGGGGEETVCGERLYTRPGAQLVTCRGCDASGTVEQWQVAITGETQAVVDAYAAAAGLSRLYGREFIPATVRQWGTRGRIVTLTEASPTAAAPDRRLPARDDEGRAQYEWSSVLAYAAHLYGSPFVTGPRLRVARQRIGCRHPHALQITTEADPATTWHCEDERCGAEWTSIRRHDQGADTEEGQAA